MNKQTKDQAAKDTDSFEAIAATRRLKAAGMSQPQAEAVVLCLEEAMHAFRSGLATKQDLAEFRSDVAIRFAEFEGRFQRTLRIHTAVILGALGSMLGGVAAMLAVLFQFAGN